MNLETILTCPVHKTTGRLIAEIHRIRAVQKLIQAADRALHEGRDDILRTLGFGEEHIADLKKLAAATSKSAFPKYVRQNNKRMIRHLRKEIESLKCQLCSDRLTQSSDRPVDTSKGVDDRDAVGPVTIRSATSAEVHDLLMAIK